MDLICLRSFREVAACGSITKAAERLGYAQSSVTAQLQKLEETYGAELLERRGRRMELTTAGERLLVYAKEMLRLHAESLEAVGAAQGGSLTIGSIESLASYFLPPHLQAFREMRPAASLSLLPGNEPELLRGVKSGTLDAALILDPPLRDPELDVHPLRREPLLLVCRPSHRLATEKAVAATELDGETLVLTENGCSYRAALLRRLREIGAEARIACELGSIEAIKRCVRQGLGVSLLPSIAVRQEVEEGKLAAVLLEEPTFDFQIQLIHLPKRRSSPAFASFLASFGVQDRADPPEQAPKA
ncbi:LysR family transcriptional regulator [Paenibacillus albicereus]|uniref:LysR family transcriptional regulator n=1 Tax=Paenibacillus albicereus TaxID=2726185 RepID=A0A6H2GXL6_9BACL|nr:LysR family transcriptional regulator [Paenibacillus albicereus]QJC52099.1 LysR family transcriptional regulator [Paenibacillus albicereus]